MLPVPWAGVGQGLKAEGERGPGLLSCRLYDGRLGHDGLLLLSTSKRIVEAGEAAAVFGGSAAFECVASGALGSGVAERIRGDLDESLRDSGFGGCAGLMERADEALAMLKAGDLDGALASEMGKMPLAVKLKMGFMWNGEVFDEEEFFPKFTVGSTFAERSDEEAVGLVLTELGKVANGGSAHWDPHRTYMWRRGRFVARAVKREASGGWGGECSTLPLVLLSLLIRGDKAARAAHSGYFAHPTKEDGVLLSMLVAGARSRGVDLEAALPNDLLSPLMSFVERSELEGLERALGRVAGTMSP